MMRKTVTTLAFAAGLALAFGAMPANAAGAPLGDYEKAIQGVLDKARHPSGAKLRPPCLHEKFTDENTVFVRCGSVAYMVDRGGDALSNGYHSFKRMDDGRWLAKVGAVLDLLEPNGQFIVGGFHEIERTDYGYHAQLGALTFRLDHDGRPIK